MLSLVWKMSLTLTVTQNSFIRKGEELRPPDGFGSGLIMKCQGPLKGL